MPIKINVEYGNKDIAKSQGAFWDAEHKTWFIPDNRDINDFMQWINRNKVSLVLKSPIFCAVNTRECYSCSELTTVIALASNNFYCLDYDDNDNEKWFQEDYFSFFSMPTYINGEVTNMLNKLFPHYKIGYSKTVGGKYWANHCEHCGTLQGDFYLHSEPGGAFFPLDIEDYKRITLIKISTKFDVELKADASGASNADEILDYASFISLEEFLRYRENKISGSGINHTKDIFLTKERPALIFRILTKVNTFFK